MQQHKFRRVSIESMAQQTGLLSETPDFVVSHKPNRIGELTFDFMHPHIVEGIGFAFCTSGSARVKVNLISYNVARNTVVVIGPSSVVQILEQSEDLQAELLFFSFDFISNIKIAVELGTIADAVSRNACLNLNEEHFQEIMKLHAVIVNQYGNIARYTAEIINGLVQVLIYRIIQLYSEMEAREGVHKTNRRETIYRQFMSLLFQHYKTTRIVQFYASELCLTPKYLLKLVRQTSGLTAAEWIDEMVIMAAKALLKGSDLTVAQISDELNFANPSFFGTYFKKQAGVSPMQYRGT